MALKGSCLCGAVTIELEEKAREFGACHCGMCRKFSGGVNLSFHAKPGEAKVSGEENIAVYASSDWAERAFCKTCGSSLFYRITADWPIKGEMYIGAGLFDDLGEQKLNLEIFIDKKPGGYAFTGNHERWTEAEFLERVGAG